VVYTRSGTYLTAAVVGVNSLSVCNLSVAGFVVDNMLYSYEASDPYDAHYLAALLNAPCVDAAVKPFQTRGAFGARDFHRRPFEVLPNPIPLFDPQNERHLRLAELSRRCHQRVADMKLPQDKRIGRLRQEVREALREELQEIDRLARELLGL
jgi:hypothetical protein